MSESVEKVNLYDHGPYHWFLPYFYARKYERALELVAGLLKPADVVLDLGCGDGRRTALLANRVHIIVGLDHQLLPLQFARLLIKHSNVKLCCGDSTALLFRPEIFDAVTCFDVLEHIPQEKVSGLIMGVRHVLRPGGLFIVTTPNRDSLHNRLWGHRLNTKHYHEYNLSELCDTLCAHGYVIEHQAGIYLPPPILQPYLEHYANIFPVKYAFLLLIRAGSRLPDWSEELMLVARRGDIR